MKIKDGQNLLEVLGLVTSDRCKSLMRVAEVATWLWSILYLMLIRYNLIFMPIN